MSASDTSRIACAENISLLHLISPVPELPSANKRPDAASLRQNYQLAFKKELLLARALAFLSSVSDDAHHVTAVCIQEHGSGLDVLIAINKSEYFTASGTLKTICHGLDEIFKRIAQPIVGKSLLASKAV